MSRILSSATTYWINGTAREITMDNVETFIISRGHKN